MIQSRRMLARANVSSEHPSIEFCSVPEAAKILRVNRKTVLSAIYRKQLPAAKIGHNWRIDLAAFRRRLAKGATR